MPLTTDEAVLKWRKAGRYLPKFLRDFHDQKDLFKTIHQTVAVDRHEYCKDVSWVAGQCYIIDIFLWFMARHGYTLQRTPAKLPFDSLDETLRNAKEARDRALAKALDLPPIDQPSA